jgi:hypothetical protein
MLVDENLKAASCLSRPLIDQSTMVPDMLVPSLADGLLVDSNSFFEAFSKPCHHGGHPCGKFLADHIGATKLPQISEEEAVVEVIFYLKQMN